MKFLLILFMLTSCVPLKVDESFFIKGGTVYHVGRRDTTKLTNGDLRILQIDSLNKYIKPKRKARGKLKIL